MLKSNYLNFNLIIFCFLANLSQEEPKPIENKSESEVPETNKTSNTGFDLDELFRMDWIPGLLQVSILLIYCY